MHLTTPPACSGRSFLEHHGSALSASMASQLTHLLDFDSTDIPVTVTNCPVANMSAVFFRA